jgi:hypothetical protein
MGFGGLSEGNAINLVRSRVEACHHYYSSFVGWMVRVVHVFNFPLGVFLPEQFINLFKNSLFVDKFCSGVHVQEDAI